jgi:hypothetical protein
LKVKNKKYKLNWAFEKELRSDFNLLLQDTVQLNSAVEMTGSFFFVSSHPCAVTNNNMCVSLSQTPTCKATPDEDIRTSYTQT